MYDTCLYSARSEVAVYPLPPIRQELFYCMMPSIFLSQRGAVTVASTFESRLAVSSQSDKAAGSACQIYPKFPGPPLPHTGTHERKYSKGNELPRHTVPRAPGAESPALRVTLAAELPQRRSA